MNRQAELGSGLQIVSIRRPDKRSVRMEADVVAIVPILICVYGDSSPLRPIIRHIDKDSLRNNAPISPSESPPHSGSHPSYSSC